MRILKNINIALFCILGSFGCSDQNLKFAGSRGTLNERPFVKALYSEPLTFDPVQMDDTTSLIFSNLVYDGLLKFSPFMELLPSIAESWQTDNTGRNIKFKLRQNTFFHNGDRIKSVDVASSLTRAVAKNSKVYKYYDCIDGASEFHEGKAKSVSGLQVLDDSSILIRLKYPFPPFLSILAGGTAKILPHDLVNKSDFFKSPIGSGPFKFDSITKTENTKEILLSKFEKYYTETKLSKIILRALDEKLANQQASLGEIHDLANFPLTGTEQIFKSGLKIDSPAAWTWIIGLNARRAPFNRKDVRLAFRDSIDTEAFRKEFYPDALPAFGYVPPGMPGYKSTLAQRKSKNISVPKDKITILFPNVLKREKEMRAFLEKNLRAHGWNIEFRGVDWQSLMKGYADKTLQGFVVAMNIDYPDTEFLARNFESNNPESFSGLKDPNIDLLLRKARTESDRLVRDKLYSRVIDLINNSAVTVNLFHPRSHYWINECVNGFEPNLLSDVYIDYTKISFKDSCKSAHDQAAR